MPLLGCAAEEDAGLAGSGGMLDAGAETDAATPDGSRLTRLGASSLTLGYGEESTLRVRYVDAVGAPRRDETVRFALTGSTADSSLISLEDRTNDDGVAEVTLRAGQQEAVFSVRISAARAPVIYVDVAVSNAGFGTLVVALAYDGARNPMQRTVSLHAGASCDDMSVPATRRQSTAYHDPTDARFLALPSGISYAVRARLEGRNLIQLAEGCTDEVDVSSDSERRVMVTLADEPLEPGGRFPIDMHLDSTAVAATTSTAARQAGNARVATEADPQASDMPQAELLLNALEVTLERNGLTDASTALSDARNDGDAAASLQALLDERARGPYLAVDTLADAVDDSLHTTRVLAELQVMRGAQSFELSWTPSQVQAVSEAGAHTLQAELENGTQSTVTGSFDPERDRIHVDALSFALPWGSLASRAVHATVGADTEETAVHHDVGCPELAQWVEQQDGIRPDCDATCVESSCGRALQWLTSAMETRLLQLDADRPKTTFEGVISIEDTNGDLEVERLSSDDIHGRWEPAERGDTLSGTLRSESIE